MGRGSLCSSARASHTAVYRRSSFHRGRECSPSSAQRRRSGRQALCVSVTDTVRAHRRYSHQRERRSPRTVRPSRSSNLLEAPSTLRPRPSAFAIASTFRPCRMGWTFSLEHSHVGTSVSGSIVRDRGPVAVAVSSARPFCCTAAASASWPRKSNGSVCGSAGQEGVKFTPWVVDRQAAARKVSLNEI